VATPQRRRVLVPLAGAAGKGDRVAVAVPKGAVSEAPAIRPRRDRCDRDAAGLSGHYLGGCGDRTPGARRARGRGRGARLQAATAPPAAWSAVAGMRAARGRGSQAQRSGRGWWWSLAGLGVALVVAAVVAGRLRRRRAAGVGAVLGRVLGVLLAAFQGALPGRRGRRWLGSLGGPRRAGDRRLRGAGADPIAASSGLTGSWW
jgi:hypothetical protein